MALNRYICWDKKRMPEYKYLVKGILETDYWLYNDLDEAFASAAALSEEYDSTFVILERVRTDCDEWKMKLTMRVWCGGYFDEGDGRIGVHYMFYTEAGNWMNKPDDYEPPQEYQEWCRSLFS